ncbi:pyridine nucleotide-disulfide oxidoreductase [Niallia nealsonii]|uniref:Pyridine nucleotide-disulfide oxidoreductase n=2 Tax=Niallia nealsonii TaxID=115979 RepID=A0A2N0YZ70_9BACI|nr:NAD(P)/FAD-dependent oxidoreductase [Niallia nealsonii]PKG22545.1 pyridine nucleotide-disulfide oxidoreductase [Niallia nealsonii]
MYTYDCIIVGGGMAGLQAAIQLGRYQHKVLVIDGGHGRSTLCRSYHNILGYPSGVSGDELRLIGKKQAVDLGILFETAMAIHAEKQNGQFIIETDLNKRHAAKRLLLATGIMDTIPPFANLFPCLGISVYVCPDCDGYEVKEKKTVVIGNGNVGANMALTLTYWTKEIIYINHGGEDVDENLLNRLKVQNIPYINNRIVEVESQESQLKSYVLEGDVRIETNKSFLAFGGNKVKSDLASQLGVKLAENRHIDTDSRTKETNIQHVFAAGDVAVHSEQVTIAMGEGSQAAIWIHKSLLEEN